MNSWNVDASVLIEHLVPTMTVWREASDQGAAGMAAVAWVILNRMRERTQTAGQVCLAPYQFSSMDGAGRWPADPSFRQAFEIWMSCLAGTTPDPTGGADLYYSTIINPPSWTERARFLVQIGKQKFYKDV